MAAPFRPLGDRPGYRDALDVTLTGAHFNSGMISPLGGQPVVQSSNPHPDSHEDIAAFDVQKSEGPCSDKQFPFFIRGGQRYHISTMVAGAEIYHTFTLDQWEKIADKMDAVKASGLGKAALTEFAINLSTESYTGIKKDNPDSYVHTALSPTHDSYGTFKTLRSHVQDLLPMTITSMGFHDAYASQGSDREVFSAITESLNKKGNKKTLSEFIQEAGGTTGCVMDRVHTYGLPDPHDSREEAKIVAFAVICRQEGKVKALEEGFIERLADGTSTSRVDTLEKELTDLQSDLSIAGQQTGGVHLVKDITAKIEKTKNTLAAYHHKEQLRIAAYLHNSQCLSPIADHETRPTAEQYEKTPITNTQAILQNAFDARLVLCHQEGLIDEEGRIRDDMSAAERVKYEEITDTAALLIPALKPAQEGGKSESDHMIQLFYGGGSALNALTHRSSKRLEGNTEPVFPVFPNVIPPEGKSSKVHVAMREIMQKVVYFDPTELVLE